MLRGADAHRPGGGVGPVAHGVVGLLDGGARDGVCDRDGAGFGIRRAEQVRALAPHADGVVVGSALVETLERGEDPEVFLRSLRARA